MKCKKTAKDTTRPAREQKRIAAMLDELAGHDSALVEQAATAVCDPDTGRAHLRDVTTALIQEKDPALHATLRAAEAFARENNLLVTDLCDMPGFLDVVAHTGDNPRAAADIFNAAASVMKSLTRFPHGAATPRDRASVAAQALGNVLQAYRQAPVLH